MNAEKVKEAGPAFPGITMRVDDVSDPFGNAPPPPQVDGHSPGGNSPSPMHPIRSRDRSRHRLAESSRDREKGSLTPFADDDVSQEDGMQSGGQTGSSLNPGPAIMVTSDSNQSEFLEPVSPAPSSLARRAARRNTHFRRGSMFPAAAPGTPQPPGNAPSAPNVQVLTIPQLDAIQRTQKVLDSRLTVLQQQTEAINISDGLHICLSAYQSPCIFIALNTFHIQSSV